MTTTFRLLHGSKTMSEKARQGGLSLWDQLPKAEREKITRELEAKRNESPKAQNGRRGGSFQLKGYVRCELSKSEKEEYKAWEEATSNVQCYERLIKLADSGYLLKVGDTGNGFQASLCAATTGKPWDGYVLVSHAGHAARAVMLLVYKHEVLMQSDWSGFLSEEGEDSFR